MKLTRTVSPSTRRGGRSAALLGNAFGHLADGSISCHLSRARKLPGATPFGFAFTSHNLLVVSEAFGGAANKSAVSSYWLNAEDGVLQSVTRSLNVGQTAACWIAITYNGGYAYASNTASKTISGFKISANGALTPLDKNGVTSTTGAGPTDLAAYGDHALFVLNSNDGSVESYSIAENGALVQHGISGGMPLTHPAGLIVR